MVYRRYIMVKGKVIIVTGASQGLGKELSLQLSKLGAKLALISRNEALLKDIKSHISENGGESEYFVCDVSDLNQVQETIKKVTAKFGTIDVLVNGAGIWTTDEFEENRPELIEQAFKVNSIGPIYLTKTLLPIFKKQNSGHIFNVISKAGLDIPDNKDWPTYAATKWAMTGYTQALKYHLQDTKIKVTGFFPGAFESNIFETLGEKDAHNQPWMMRTADVASAIVFTLNAPEDLWINTIGMSNN